MSLSSFICCFCSYSILSLLCHLLFFYCFFYCRLHKHYCLIVVIVYFIVKLLQLFVSFSFMQLFLLLLFSLLLFLFLRLFDCIFTQFSANESFAIVLIQIQSGNTWNGCKVLRCLIDTALHPSTPQHPP